MQNESRNGWTISFSNFNAFVKSLNSSVNVKFKMLGSDLI